MHGFGIPTAECNAIKAHVENLSAYPSARKVRDSNETDSRRAVRARWLEEHMQ